MKKIYPSIAIIIIFGILMVVQVVLHGQKVTANKIENDVEKCGSHFNGINIKLTKCGGLTPAIRMIKKAKSMGLKVMVGCMTESSVGISAIAQLLPQLDYVDMDGAILLKEDIATGIHINDDGSLVFPKLGGSGITLK